MRISRATIRHWNKQRAAERAAKWEAERVEKLAAAAPEMLDVLQVIAADIENRARLGLSAPAWYARARAAIDKATGV